MALATVTGLCWSGLARVIPGFRSVPDGNVTTIGVRDLDEEEAAAINASGVRRVEVDSLRADLHGALSNHGDLPARMFTSISTFWIQSRG
jgi:hypothetical protein